MIPARQALTTSHANPTSRRLIPVAAHIRATRRRFTPRAAQAIPTSDHFAQQNEQREVIANDMNVGRTGTFTDIDGAAYRAA